MTELVLEDQPVRLLGDRRFHAGRLTSPDQLAGFEERWQALDAQHVRGEGAMGVALVVAPDVVPNLPADAVWADTKLLYAGYRPDGHQVRVRHFTGALCCETYPGGPFDFDPDDWQNVFALGDGYEIRDYADSGVSDDQVVDFWEREGALVDLDDPRRRVAEVRVVGLTGDGEVVGVGSGYEVEHGQTRSTLMAQRAFVGREHRRTNVATHITFRTCDLLVEQPGRATGLLLEIENPGVRQAFAQAVWPLLPYSFIGMGGADGEATMYVCWLDGAQAPPP